jgi:prepilin-type N-terminal cleavage/methylation domain-containing protein
MIHGRRTIRRRGVTLLEMSISITVMGILLALTVPSFSRVREQNQVDGATQYLRSIWCAERVYWLENKTFTDSMADLKGLNLIDAKLMAQTGGYMYVISDATTASFTATATRTGSDHWTGTLQITQDGEVTGFVSDGGGSVLTPPDF